MWREGAEEPEEGEYGVEFDQKRQPVFADANLLKEKLKRDILAGKYDVTTFYKTKGIPQLIARSHYFESVTLFIVAANCCWIAYDVDHNDAEFLPDADLEFQVGENFFCAFFLFEWATRFLAFEVKCNCIRDAWFVFDSFLLVIMVGETWAMTILVLVTGGGASELAGQTSLLRMVRMLRLSRMARISRLLRAMPEIMIIIKGMVVATKAVFFTLTLMLFIIYIFGVMFTQLTRDTEVGDTYFRTVGGAAWELLTTSIVHDNFRIVLEALFEQHLILSVLYGLFVFLSSIVMMNMLIGLLVEVVSVVATTERESLVLHFVRSKLKEMMMDGSWDSDGDEMISKAEFQKLLENKKARAALTEVGVDVVGLVDLADFIFLEEVPGESAREKNLTFADFMDVVLQFRGTNSATVRDIVDLRKFVHSHFSSLIDRMSPPGLIRAGSRSQAPEAGAPAYTSESARSGTPSSFHDGPTAGGTSAAQEMVPASHASSTVPNQHGMDMPTSNGHAAAHKFQPRVRTAAQESIEQRLAALEKLLSFALLQLPPENSASVPSEARLPSAPCEAAHAVGPPTAVTGRPLETQLARRESPRPARTELRAECFEGDVVGDRGQRECQTKAEL